MWGEGYVQLAAVYKIQLTKRSTTLLSEDSNAVATLCCLSMNLHETYVILALLLLLVYKAIFKIVHLLVT